jgi:hypothetical protein
MNKSGPGSRSTDEINFFHCEGVIRGEIYPVYKRVIASRIFLEPLRENRDLSGPEGKPPLKEIPGNPTPPPTRFIYQAFRDLSRVTTNSQPELSAWVLRCFLILPIWDGERPHFRRWAYGNKAIFSPLIVAS